MVTSGGFAPTRVQSPCPAKAKQASGLADRSIQAGLLALSPVSQTAASSDPLKLEGPPGPSAATARNWSHAVHPWERGLPRICQGRCPLFLSSLIFRVLCSGTKLTPLPHTLWSDSPHRGLSSALGCSPALCRLAPVPCLSLDPHLREHPVCLLPLTPFKECHPLYLHPHRSKEQHLPLPMLRARSIPGHILPPIPDCILEWCPGLGPCDAVNTRAKSLKRFCVFMLL